MTRAGIIAAAAVILASNAMVLVGVGRNRSGTPVQTITLTEHELALNYQREEDSGVALKLEWNRYPMIEDAWLDRPKLEALGFDCAAALRDPVHYRQLPRPAFIVIEYDGPAFQHWLKSLEETVRVSKPDPNAYPRLVVIDAGKTVEPLLSRYADHQRYLVLRGVVEVHVNDWDPKTQKPGSPHLQPSFTVLTSSIHVSPPLSRVLANLPYPAIRNQSRYSVTLAVGRRFEPWVMDIQKP